MVGMEEAVEDMGTALEDALMGTEMEVAEDTVIDVQDTLADDNL